MLHPWPATGQGAVLHILHQVTHHGNLHHVKPVSPACAPAPSSPGLQMEARPTEDTDRQTLLYCVLTGLAVLTICLIVYIIGGDEDNTLPAN